MSPGLFLAIQSAYERAGHLMNSQIDNDHSEAAVVSIENEHQTKWILM